MATDREKKREERKAKREKKKAPTAKISLPKARAQLKRQKEMNRMRSDREGANNLLTGLIVVLLILFILLGGINQRKTWEAAKRLGANVGQTVASWFNPDSVDVNDDGVYIK